MPQGATTAEVMADYIKAAGIPFMFGYPGTSNIEFMEAARRRGVDTVLGRREGTVAAMAEAYGMLTGRPGVCISTLGPGSTALLPGVTSAYLDRVPVLAISGQISSAREPYFTHQVVDHTRIYAPVTKWAGRVEAGSVGTIMRKALRTAVAERPGAVHLTVNSDVAAAEASDSDIQMPPTVPAVVATQVFRTEGSGRDPELVVGESHRPVLLAGTAALRSGASDSLIRCAEAFGAPVVVSPMAKGVFPEDHALFAGVVDMAAKDVVWELLDNADLIVTIGFDPVELIKSWKVTTPVLHVDSVPNTDQVYPAEIEMVGHIPGILDSLTAESGGGSTWTVDELRQHRTRLKGAYYRGRVTGKLNPTDVIDVLRASAPRDTIVTTDVGSHKLLVGQGWTTYEPRSCLMSNGLSAMGFALPAAIAAKLASSERPVVCTVGDGGFAMVQGELRLASESGLGFVTIVFCDESLNRIELKQKRLGYPSTATTFAPSHVAGIAESMSCDGAVASSSSELEKILAEAGDLATLDRPLVVETRIDPAQYEDQF